MTYNLAYVGSVLPHDALAQHPAASVAGNKYQTGFLRALEEHISSVEAFTVAPHAMWRGAGKVRVARWTTTLSETIKVSTIPYVNVLVLKQICIALNLVRNLFAWSWQKRASHDRIIMVYNTFSYEMIPALLVARATRSRLLAIVADVPLPDNRAGLLRRLENRIELLLVGQSDGLICLTRHTGDDFGRGAPAVVVEGGWEQTPSTAKGPPGLRAQGEDQQTEHKKIVYAGALNSVAGVELLLEAMTHVKHPSVELHVYGHGPSASSVEQAVRNLPGKVVFHGKMDHEHVLECEAQADLLVCPRIPDGYVTRYTFPSKVIEYMGVGVPVMCNRLEGLTSEYLSRAIVPTAPDAKSWAACIDRVLSDTSGGYWELAYDAAEFIRRHKCWNSSVIPAVELMTLRP